MSRRVSKSAVVILALTMALSAPSAFAARRSPDGPSGPVDRIVEALKKIVRGFVPTMNEEVVLPTPPKP